MVQSLKHNAEVGSNDKPPLLINELDFPEWKERFERYVRAKDIKIWLCIVKGCGATPVRTLTIDTYLALTDDQKKFYDCEEKAMSMITMAMTQSILHTFRKRNSSKELWDSMIQRYEGNEMYKKRRLERLKTQFVVFKALKNESFDDTVNRFYHLLSELDRSKEGIYTEFEKVEKFLNCLSREWNMYTALIREGVLYEELTLEEVVQKLRGYAWNMEDQASEFEKIQDPQLYKASKPTDKGSSGGVGVALYSENEGHASEHAFISNNFSSSGTTNSNQGMYSSSGAQKSQGTSVNIPKIDASCLKMIEENMSLLASFMTAYENFCLGKLVEPSSLDEDFDQIDQDEMEELDLQLNMALLVRRAKKFLLKTGRKFIGGQTKTRMGVDMSKVKCYNCGIYGHFARDCRKPKMERSDRDNNSRGNNSRPQYNASNATSNSNARSSGSENTTSSTNNAMVAQPLQSVTEPYDWGCALENISGAIVSQAFIAEIVNEEVYEEVVEETSIEELAVVAEVLGEELDSGNVTENESPSIEETVEKPSKTEDGEKGERFEFNISTAEMQQFADAEAKRLEENSVENEACAFMAGIEEQLKRAIYIWYIDSGCSRHMTGNKELLNNFKQIRGGYVNFAGEKGGYITGEGSVSNGKITLHKVNYVEELKHNLMSVSQICDNKYTMLFTDKACFVLRPGFVVPEDWIVIRAPRVNNTYVMDMRPLVNSSAPVTCLLSKATEDQSYLWHRRMGHVHLRKMNHLVKNNLVLGVPLRSFNMHNKCESCEKGKIKRKPHKPKTVNSIQKPLELLHMDLFGPIHVASIGGMSYCLVVTDDFSRYSWVFFLKTKDQTAGILRDLFKQLEKNYSLPIKKIRSDNGTEFKNQYMDELCREMGIIHQFSAPYVPQQNGVAERKNRTLIEAARTMLSESKLPIFFWAEAVNTACYVLNHVLTVKREDKTCYELLEGRKPNVSGFQPFGIKCVIKRTKDTPKMGEVGEIGFFLGYANGTPNKRVYNIKKRTVEIVFDITPLSFDPPPSEFGPKSGYDYDKLFDSFDLPDVSEEDSEVVYTHLVNKDEVDASWRASIPTNVSSSVPVADSSTVNDVVADQIPNAAAQTTSGDLYVDFSAYPNVDASSGNGGASSSTAHAEGEIQSNLGNNLQAPAIPVPRTNIHHPVDNIIGNPSAGVQTRRSISEMQCLFSAIKKEEIYNLSLHECFISQIEPKNYQMALKDNSWCEAMQEELAQFDKLKVWNLVDLPKGQHAINTKWVLSARRTIRVSSSETRHGWLFKASIRKKGLIIQKFMHRWQDWKLFVCF
ncbi:putative RNA-directed DNA polymerase [Helianthus annuus]|nr:putative RNA-directed DNA polymerase [Helianthus annuus]KAJ0541959.1 putative RNA-directed DNA polymerase [Helianthus annuus]KAJ0707027.1 putative RNA-directed DNA polymerase [Helianthus annuus]KAJ0887680.1 putative RNA-directed DNA polymerase [Helianthus annuus]